VLFAAVSHSLSAVLGQLGGVSNGPRLRSHLAALTRYAFVMYKGSRRKHGLVAHDLSLCDFRAAAAVAFEPLTRRLVRRRSTNRAP